MNLILFSELSSHLTTRGLQAFQIASNEGEIIVYKNQVLKKESRIPPYVNYMPICQSIFDEKGIMLSSLEIASIFNS